MVASLRAAIFDLSLKPGQRLVERELIERLGVSRTTVREALRDLISDGLVTVVPQRGAIVSIPSAEEAADLYEIRAVLESLLVRHFVDRVDDDDVARLVASVDEYDHVVATSTDVREILAAKDRFYAVLLAGAQSPTLQQLLGGLKARVHVLRATSLAEDGRPQQVVSELRAIVEAVCQRDGALASQLFAEHVRRASATALRALERGQNAAAPA
ncbi:GntR family transcriptional regulator [Microbacterium sp. STN6]|uniref:GntR family transcriptional regulator n=1 Tax=Microbacterium sp. STN6 TaxID=2995588 RepID=UPI0022608F60|nr:GntR family transcriptional regulator [Microbacterium sp. STN6]MCX7521002.1 GntR family transcriptional regulator [Microbacterium sp. STN6]